MPINIIIKDRRTKQAKAKEQFAKDIIKGYYHTECDGSYKRTGRTKNQIKKEWESFPHDSAVDKYPADMGLPNQD